MKRLVSLGFGVFALDRKAEEPEPGVIPVAADVTDVESVRKAAEVVVRHTTDELFALVHQAGIYRLDSLVEMSEESFEKVFRVNLFGVSLVNRIFFSVSAQGKPPCDHHKRAGAAPSSSVYRNLCREQERFGPVCPAQSGRKCLGTPRRSWKNFVNPHRFITAMLPGFVGL